MKGILCLCFIVSLVCVTECAYRSGSRYSYRSSRYYSYYGGGGSLSTGGIIGLCVGLTVGIAVVVVALLCYLNVIKKPTCCVPKSKVGSHNAVTYSSNPVTTSHQAPTDPVTHPPPPAPDMPSSYPPAYTSPYPPPPYGYDPQSQPMKN